MTAISDLLKRVEDASEPDPMLDQAIYEALRPPYVPGTFDSLPLAEQLTLSEWAGSRRDCTASIEAALALVGRKLPDWAYSLTNDYGGYNRAYLNVAPGCEGYPTGGLSVEATCETMPLAIVAALLRALEQTP